MDRDPSEGYDVFAGGAHFFNNFIFEVTWNEAEGKFEITCHDLSAQRHNQGIRVEEMEVPDPNVPAPGPEAPAQGTDALAEAVAEAVAEALAEAGGVAEPRGDHEAYGDVAMGPPAAQPGPTLSAHPRGDSLFCDPADRLNDLAMWSQNLPASKITEVRDGADAAAAVAAAAVAAVAGGSAPEAAAGGGGEDSDANSDNDGCGRGEEDDGDIGGDEEEDDDYDYYDDDDVIMLDDEDMDNDLDMSSAPVDYLEIIDEEGTTTIIEMPLTEDEDELESTDTELELELEIEFDSDTEGLEEEPLPMMLTFPPEIAEAAGGRRPSSWTSLFSIQDLRALHHQLCAVSSELDTCLPVLPDEYNGRGFCTFGANPGGLQRDLDRLCFQLQSYLEYALEVCGWEVLCQLLFGEIVDPEDYYDSLEPYPLGRNQPPDAPIYYVLRPWYDFKPDSKKDPGAGGCGGGGCRGCGSGGGGGGRRGGGCGGASNCF